MDHRLALAAAALLLTATPAHAQQSDSLATVNVRVVRDTTPDAPPVAQALVTSGDVRTRSDVNGVARLRLAPGVSSIVARRPGFRPDSATLVLRPAADTSIVLVLVANPVNAHAVVVSATRGDRRVEDTPIRVEVIDEDEIAEKVTMSPGDIAMMLNETGGLRVQTTNPSLGGANVRIQGLRGRYSLLLTDGLPLYGAQAGSLGLLQIPPVDLGRVEIIKGTASALYGSAALGGVINLVSRRVDDERSTTALINQTSRGGTDAVVFAGAPVGDRLSYTVLAGAHRQSRNDLDGDRFTDMPGYDRVVVRPRLWFDNGSGHTAFVTGGFAGEDRRGGTLPGAVLSSGIAHDESLNTRRADFGILSRWQFGRDTSVEAGEDNSTPVLTIRASGMEQRHRHTFGADRENDGHRTLFGEATLAVPVGAFSMLTGVALQQERYRNDSLPEFDYSFNVPGAFLQADIDVARWLSMSASARTDWHNIYGSFLSPRISALLRARDDGMMAGWTTRISAGSGFFAPTPFTEETEATGLTRLRPLRDLAAERAASGSVDIGGPVHSPIGAFELNFTGFASNVRDAVQPVYVGGFPIVGARPLALRNAPGLTRTRGGELLARFVRELGESDEDGGEDHEAPLIRVTATYTHLRSTECSADADATASVVSGNAVCLRREVPLTPRHAAGIVTTVEQEGRSRIGVELYYTGRQSLADNPYRAVSKPYLIVGLMGERAIETRMGVARFFVNFENITNVRQTRFDPLVLPQRNPDGRWTTDAWTDLAGFTVNGGVRWTW